MTPQVVIAELAKRGISASWEHPGYFHVPTRGGFAWNIGDCNGSWQADLCGNGDAVLDSVDMVWTSPSDTDAQIAAGIAVMLPDSEASREREPAQKLVSDGRQLKVMQSEVYWFLVDADFKIGDAESMFTSLNNPVAEAFDYQVPSRSFELWNGGTLEDES